MQSHSHAPAHAILKTQMRRPFQEGHATTCTCTHTYAKAFRHWINYTSKTNYVWSRNLPNLTVKQTAVFDQTEVTFTEVIWFWKLLIAHRSQKSFLLSPVYKNLKGTFAHTRNKKGTQLKKTSNATAAFFKNKPKEWLNKFVALLAKEK